jgi:hypothetical protein
VKKCYVTLPNVQISRNGRRGHVRAARFVALGKQCDGITKASENQARGAAESSENNDSGNQYDTWGFPTRSGALFGASALDLLISRSSCNEVGYLFPVLCGVAG